MVIAPVGQRCAQLDRINDARGSCYTVLSTRCCVALRRLRNVDRKLVMLLVKCDGEQPRILKARHNDDRLAALLARSFNRVYAYRQTLSEQFDWNLQPVPMLLGR